MSDAPWCVETKAALSDVPSDRRLECRNCGAPATDLHHIVPKGRLPQAHPSRTDVKANGLPLCQNCHIWGWHDGNLEIAQNVLTHEEMSSAVRLVGQPWVDRRYPPKVHLEANAIPW